MWIVFLPWNPKPPLKNILLCLWLNMVYKVRVSAISVFPGSLPCIHVIQLWFFPANLSHVNSQISKNNIEGHRKFSSSLTIRLVLVIFLDIWMTGRQRLKKGGSWSSLNIHFVPILSYSLCHSNRPQKCYLINYQHMIDWGKSAKFPPTNLATNGQTNKQIS